MRRTFLPSVQSVTCHAVQCLIIRPSSSSGFPILSLVAKVAVFDLKREIRRGRCSRGDSIDRIYFDKRCQTQHGRGCGVERAAATGSSQRYTSSHLSPPQSSSHKSLFSLYANTEHALVLSKLYTDKRDSIRSVLRSESLRLSKLEHVTAELQHGISGDKYSIDMPFAEVSLQISRDGTRNDQTICMTRDKLNDLISQLQEVRELMTVIR